ncbi:MAG: hypothetical protein P9M15_02150, partial [Candidatus Electryoneaceae bacterium]|nr:hypothetical protein [Candidatus Electryoneaceae bacterium]
GKDYKVHIKINALERGSFQIVTEIQASLIEAIKLLLSNDSVNYASGLVGVLVGAFKLRKFLKGKPPTNVQENGTNTTVTNSKGATVTIDKRVYHCHNNVNINRSVNNTFIVLNDDPAIEDFELQDGKTREPLFQVDRSEFSNMIQDPVVETDDKQIIVKHGCTLEILKVVFKKDKRTKWSFNYDGFPISARIDDDHFLERMMHGEPFAKGETLIVDLEITQTYDPQLDSWINSDYRIIRVSEHPPRRNVMQMKLPFE